MVASLALTIVALRRKNAVSIDLETLWKTLVAGGVMAGVLVLVQIVVLQSAYATRVHGSWRNHIPNRPPPTQSRTGSMTLNSYTNT